VYFLKLVYKISLRKRSVHLISGQNKSIPPTELYFSKLCYTYTSLSFKCWRM